MAGVRRLGFWGELLERRGAASGSSCGLGFVG